MPLRPRLLERLLLSLNVLPTPLLDIPLAVGIGRVLTLACELKLFDVLEEQPLALEPLATRVECAPQGLALILPVLIEAGYLRYRGGRYANTRVARRWLTRASAQNVGPYVVHAPDIVAIWDHLPEVVREHRQAIQMPYEDDASQPEVQAALARHYAGLAALAMTLGSEAVRRVKLPREAARLLDVGGSHAAYSVLFCRRYPNLQATILDLEPGLEAGRRTAQETGMEQRLNFVATDIVRDDFTALLAEPFDAALYFHIAHLLSPELNRALVARVVSTLKPGGTFVYMDQVTDRMRGSRLSALLVQFMALTMATVGGTVYPFPTVKVWLEEAGLRDVRHHRLLTPGAALITARKPIPGPSGEAPH